MPGMQFVETNKGIRYFNSATRRALGRALFVTITDNNLSIRRGKKEARFSAGRVAIFIYIVTKIIRGNNATLPFVPIHAAMTRGICTFRTIIGPRYYTFIYSFFSVWYFLAAHISGFLTLNCLHFALSNGRRVSRLYKSDDSRRMISVQ